MHTSRHRPLIMRLQTAAERWPWPLNRHGRTIEPRQSACTVSRSMRVKSSRLRAYAGRPLAMAVAAITRETRSGRAGIQLVSMAEEVAQHASGVLGMLFGKEVPTVDGPALHVIG